MTAAHAFVLSLAKIFGSAFLALIAAWLFAAFRDRIEKRIAGMDKLWQQAVLAGITLLWASGFALACDSSHFPRFACGSSE